MKLIKALIISALLSSPLMAQDLNYGVIGPFGGLNNSDNSLVIPSNNAQDLLNVNISPEGKSVIKREGYAEAFALSITTSPVHGVYKFYDGIGNDVVLAFNDRNINSSVAGASASVIYSTASNGATWQCVDSQGYAYCANTSRDGLFYTEGTTVSRLPITATGTIVAATPERLVQAGFSDAKNRVDYSAANDFETWTVGGDPTDPVQFTITSPGSRITHLVYAHKRIYWFKEESCGYILEGDTLDDWVVRAISSNIGTLDNTSIQDTGGNLYFRGQDGHIYYTDGSFVFKLSTDIDNSIVASANQVFNSWNQTSSSDFDAGTVTPTGILTSTSTSGALQFLSNPSNTDTTDVEFLAGSVFTNISTTSTGGELARKWFTIDNWTDGDYTAGPPWTADNGSSGWSVISSKLNCAARSADSDPSPYNISSTFTAVSGTWEAKMQIDTPNIANNWRFYFIAGSYNSSKRTYNNAYYVYANTGIGAGFTLFETDSSGNPSSLATSSNDVGSSNRTIRVTRSSSGLMNVYIDGSLILTATDTTINSSSRVAFSVQGIANIGQTEFTNSTVDFDDFYYSPIVDGFGTVSTSQTQFESRSFDNTTALTSYDTFSASISTATGAVISFYTATSDDGASWDPYVSVATGASITSTIRRYIKYKAVYTSLADSQNGYFSTPTIQDVTVGRTFNAGHKSSVKNASSLTAWDSFSATKSDGGGTINFYIRSATGSFTVGSSTPIWTEVTDGSIPSISTGSYFQILSSFTVTASGQTPILYEFTQNWFEGSIVDKSYATFHDDKIMFSVAYGDGQTTNNRVLVYDLVTPGWTIYDLAANGFYIRNQDLYFGSSAGGYVYKFGDVNSDNGSAINAYWKSKDFFMDTPFNDKEVVNLSVAAASVANSSMTITYTVNGSSSSSFTMPLGNNNVFSRINKNLPTGRTGGTFNIQFGNNAADQPFETFAIQYGYRQKPWKVEP